MGKVNINELARLREERGLSYGQIALRFGVSPGYISYACMEHGIQKAGAEFEPKALTPGLVIMRNGRQVRPFTPEEDEHLLADAMADGGGRGRLCRLGRELGRAPSSIRARLYTLARHQELGVRA